MRVLITGATGFVGSEVARQAVAAGYEVAALVRPDASLWRLDGVTERVDVIWTDLSDHGAVRSAVARYRPDTCIHLAWYAEPGKYLHATENLSCLADGIALLRSLADVGCRTVVMTGTCAEYDSEAGWLHEDSPSAPATLYAATKLALGLVGRQLAQEAGIRFSWARLFYLYGPAEADGRLVPTLIRALADGRPFHATVGDQVRDYLHVADAAAGVLALARGDASGIFNVASGAPVTVRELIATVAAVVGRPDLVHYGAAPPRLWEPPFVCGDSRRLRGLGWAPRYTLQSGLAQTVQWWRDVAPAALPRP
jgi:nucleoside-diphosphate-sugar epimerase